MSSGRMTAPMALRSILAEDSLSQGSEDAANPIDSMEDYDSRDEGRSRDRGVRLRTNLRNPRKKRCIQEDSEEDSQESDLEAAQHSPSFSLVLDAGGESDSAEGSEDDVVCHGEVVPLLASKESTPPPRRTVYGLFSRRERENAIDGIHRRRVTSLQSRSSAGAASASSVTSSPPSTPPPGLKSAVWNFFSLENGRSHVAICSICQKPVKRGRAGGHLGTTAQIFHMKTHHPAKWQQATAKSNTSGSTDASPHSSPVDARSQQMTGASQQHCLPLSPAPVPPLASDSQVPSMRQPTLAETLEKKAKFPASHPVAKKLTALTAAKLALDMEPFSAVENEGFRLLMAYLAPKWEVPSRHYFSRTAVPDLYAEVAGKLGEQLTCAEVKKIHLTMDMWTSRQGADFMTVTAHWVSFTGSAASANFPRQHATLCLQAFDTASHKATDVKEKLQVVIAEWLSPRSLMPGCVTADNGSNVIAALRLSNMEHIPCFAHVLNLVVRQFLKQTEIEEMLVSARKICAHFSRSYAARNALAAFQEKHQLPKHQLRTEVATRWNSTLDMLMRLLEQRVAVIQYGMDSHHARALGGTSLTASQWQLAKQLCKILQPFLRATERVSRANASLSEVLPMLCLLQGSLKTIHLEQRDGDEASDDDKEELQRLAESMLVCLWGDPRVKAMVSSDTYLAATYLDPRFKDWVPAFTPDHNAEHILAACHSAVKARLQTEIDLHERSLARQSGMATSATTNSAGALGECGANCKGINWWCHCRLSKCGVVGAATAAGRSVPTPDELLGAYMQDKTRVSASAEPLLYWQVKKNIWPLLASVAIEALSCQPASVQSERVFSAAGAVVTDKRTRLSADSVQRLTFLKMNRHLMPSSLS